MQSYYVDRWGQGLLLEATFTPLAFGGAWLLGTGAEHQRAMLDFGRRRRGLPEHPPGSGA